MLQPDVSVLTSELLHIELAEAAFAIAMKERWGGRWRAHRTDGRSRRRAARLLHDTVSRYEALLTPVDHFTGFAFLPSAQLTMYTDHSRLASCRTKRPH